MIGAAVHAVDGAIMPNKEIVARSDQWFEDAKRLVEPLKIMVENERLEAEIASRVDDCYRLYCKYVTVTIKAVEEDISCVAAVVWTRLYEGGFTWIGSWRPTAAIMLVFSLVGIHVEADLRRLLEGIDPKSMVALSSRQLANLNLLQLKTKDAEDNISSRLAILQMLVTDQQMARATTKGLSPSSSTDLSGVMDAMKPKLADLRSLIIQAEHLRLETLRELMNILMPLQAGQYTLAAFEMAFAARNLTEHERDLYPDELLPMAKNRTVWQLASEGHTKELEEALRSGVDPSAADTDGRTPLHAAAAEGHVETVIFLLEQGANINKRDGSGYTPLQNAQEGGHNVTAQYLVRTGGKTTTEQGASTEWFNAVASPNAGSRLPFADEAAESGMDATLKNLEDDLNERVDGDSSLDGSQDSLSDISKGGRDP